MKIVFRLVTFIVLLVLALFASVWVFSPLVSQSVLKSSLEPYQLELHEDSEVRVNLFLSRIHIHKLSWHKDSRTRFRLDHLRVDYSLLKLIRSEVNVRRLIVEGVEADIRQKEGLLEVVGIASSENEAETNIEDPVSSDEAEASKGPGIRIAVDQLKLKDIRINIDAYDVKQAFQIDDLEVNELHFDGQAIDADISAQFVLEKLGEEESEIAHARLPSIDAAFKFKSRLKGKLEDQYIQFHAEQFEFTTQKLSLTDKQYDIGLNSVDVSSDLLEFEMAEDEARFNAVLNSKLAEFEVKNKGVDEVVLSLISLSTPDTEIKLSENLLSLALPSVSLSGLFFSDPGAGTDKEALAPIFFLDTLNIKNTAYLQNLAGEEVPQLSIEDVRVGEIKASAYITDSGEIGNLVLQTADNKKVNDENVLVETTTVQEKENSELGLQIKVDQIVLTDAANLYIKDESVNPAFYKDILVERLQVSDIDSRALDAPAHIAMTVKDKNYFEFDIHAEVKPFLPTTHLDLKYEMKELSVHEVSSYLEGTLGFGVEAGQLDSKSDIRIIEDELSGDVKLNLRGAKFSSGKREPSDELDVVGQAAVPLNVALNMLKDGKGNIALTIPVDGNINDPSFGVQYLIGLVAKKAVMRQAKKHLVNTFIPYGQVLSVAYSAGSYALKVRFEDLVYPAGESELNDEQKVFADQFVALMKKKEALQVRVCPFATPEDIGLAFDTALNKEQSETLLSLAKKRAENFKHYATQKGVDSSRTLVCAPKLAKGEKDTPHLALSI